LNTSRWFIPVTGLRLSRRLVQLIIGLTFFGIGIGLMLRSGLGLPPWDVLHQGLAAQIGLTVGIWSILVSFVVLAFWIPLRERYGIGTLLNAIVVGVMIDVTTAVVPEAPNTWWAAGMMLVGILLIAVTSGMYIGANLGPGPRDGLMTAIVRRGPSIRLTRVIMEVTVLVIGVLLGGTFGIGTILYALLMGPLVQIFLPRWTINTGRPEDSWDHPAR
jgi:uncharacterized membrane protein YczE